MIIGFAGRARHGKDFTAGHAQRLLRDRAVTRGFAIELKTRVRRALDGVPGLDEAVQAKPPWLRGILQAVGNGVREADQEFWVRSLFEWWQRFEGKAILWSAKDLTTKTVLLVPDVRYHNEVAAIKARGGKVVKVVRVEVADHENAWPGSILGQSTREYRDINTDPDHPSEAMVDTIPDSEFDAIFYARSGETAWLEKCIEERLVAWGLLERNDGGMGDDL